MKQKCAICFKEITATCNFNQGRCPHQPAMIDSIIADPYKARFLNLINFIKSVFK